MSFKCAQTMLFAFEDVIFLYISSQIWCALWIVGGMWLHSFLCSCKLLTQLWPRNILWTFVNLTSEDQWNIYHLKCFYIFFHYNKIEKRNPSSDTFREASIAVDCDWSVLSRHNKDSNHHFITESVWSRTTNPSTEQIDNFFHCCRSLKSWLQLSKSS